MSYMNRVTINSLNKQKTTKLSVILYLFIIQLINNRLNVYEEKYLQ